MRPDAARIRQLAGERGFGEATTEKALCLLDILGELGRHPYLRPRLVLKGGTALNLFYWDAPRLSVDLDLNYVGSPARDQMQAERPRVLSALQTIATAGGYRVQRGTPHHAAETWHFWYRSALGPLDHVAADLNFLMRVCLFPRQARACVLDPTLTFEVLALEELMAGKLVALLDRTAARDLFDAYRFVLASPPYDETRLRRAFVFFAAAGLPRPLWEYDLSRLCRITQARLQRELWPVLTYGEGPGAAAMAEAVAPLLARLLALQPEERAFCESVLAGSPALEQLFPADETLAQQAAAHPALLWKVQNISGRQET